MKLGDVIWWKFYADRAWKVSKVVGFPAEGLVKLHVKGIEFIVVSEKDIEWRPPQQ